MATEAAIAVAQRYAGSIAQIERAKRSLAGGVATAMRAGQRPVPLVIDHGEGSHLFDIDGNEYIDYVIGFGPMILGHDPAPIIDAVGEQIRRGFTFGAQHPLEAEVAERVVDIAPCGELVCFSTTGSEAVQAALRIARAATGRPKIVKFEGHYHGWIDPVFISTPGTAAAAVDTPSPLEPVPATPGQGDLSGVLVARWNDLDELAGVLDRHGEEVAAVIMEPIASNGGLIAPLPGYLEGARELTREHGAMLIFDEVVTGFRVALGGAQERYGVTPDLATYGKAIAAGMPLSAVAGTREAMEVVVDGRLAHVGTFNCAPPAAAAAKAALDVYRDGAPALYEDLEQTASRLAAGLADAAAGAGTAVKLHQVGPLVQMFFMDPADEVTSYADTAAADPTAQALFSELMLARGVIVLPRGWWFLSTAHSAGDIEATVEAARGAFAELAERG
jgi:glutamate-1-semialdehyde 2,1-aminomutase